MNTPQGSSISAARSRMVLAFLSTSLFWLGSCRTNPPGQISIDRAEVFTRERLVNRRLQEQQWLEKKLEFTTMDTTFQGAIDLRELHGIAAGLKAQFDPLGGVLQETTLNSQIQERRRQDQLAALQQDTNLLRAEIDRLKARQDLDRLKQNPGADVPGSSTAGSATATTSPSPKTPLDASALAGSWESLQKVAAPDPQDLRMTTTKLTSVEKLRDELAYRNAVHTALRETELDDAHDMNGYALRTLKFDISVIPHDERSEHIGMIRLTPNPHTAVFEEPNELADVYRAWQQTVLQQAQFEALSLQRRYLQGLITDDDIVASLAVQDHVRQALVRLLEEREAARPRDPNRAIYLRKAMAGLKALRLNDPNRQLDPNTSIALCKIVEWGYGALHGRYLYFNDIPTFVHVDGRLLYLPDLWPSPENVNEADHCFPPAEGCKALAYRKKLLALWAKGGPTCCREEEELAYLKTLAEDQEKALRRIGRSEQTRQAGLSDQVCEDADRLREFARDIHGLNREFKPYIYTVEPKELAQNISDVAAVERLSSWVVAASAALPQSGIDAGGFLNHLDRSQLRLQAILRRPLVVGFVGREDQKEDKYMSSFGWALGPRFEIGSGANVRFRQAEAQHSVQATMALPGWWDKIEFRYQVGWRDPRGDWPAQRKMRTQWKEERHLTVDLSRDYEAITAALLGLHESREQDPTVLPARRSESRTASYLLTEGEEKAALLIRGSNLWRNPQVFIGAQKAETVAVLPDMGGLYATFDKVRLPASVDGDSARVDLTIVTSQGVTRLPQAVQILPKGTAKPTGTVQLKTACATPGGKLQFVASKGLIPDTPCSGPCLRARDAAQMTWCDVLVEASARKTGEDGTTEMTFTLDRNQKLVARPARLAFDLAIQDEYGTPYHSVPSFAGVKGELVYFPKADQGKLKTPKDLWKFRLKQQKAEKETRPSPEGEPSTIYVPESNLVFETDPNVSLDLFKRAYPWLAEEKTAFRLECAWDNGERSVVVPLGPGELQLTGDKPGKVLIAGNDLIGRSTGTGGSKEKALFDLYDTVVKRPESKFEVKIKIRHPNGNDVVEVDREVVLLGPAESR